MFQYDSDGSDSQGSSEEAELRRKKIEALKVSLSHILQDVGVCEKWPTAPLQTSSRRTWPLQKNRTNGLSLWADKNRSKL